MFLSGDAEPLLSRGVIAAFLLGAVPILACLLRILRKPGVKLPPGSFGFPFIGEMMDYTSSPLRFSLERARKFGTPFCTHVLFKPTIALSEDDDLEWLWDMERKGVAVSNGARHIRQLLGRGNLIHSSGMRHRMLRRLMGPAFAPAAVRDYTDIIDETTRLELEKWASSDSFRSSVDFKQLALRLLFKCIFPDVSEDIITMLCREITIWFEGFHVLFPFALPGTTLSKSLAARGRLILLIKSLVEAFKKSHSSDSETARTTFMGRLVYGSDEKGDGLDTEVLSNQILLIFFAGHDTSYATLGSLLHNISGNESVTCALTEEVSADNFQGPNLDFDELKTAPILNAVIAETWRKDPPAVGGAPRTLLRNTIYKQWEIPKGMSLQFNVGLCLYDEKRYPRPNEFRIERFLPDDHPFVEEKGFNTGVDYNGISSGYLVFGGGSHYCLGSQFARLEARIILTRMFQRYKVEVRNSEEVEFFFKTHKLEFRLTPR